ncbi:hypothetical protein EMMF5_004137 [Cystobasidiomycetes sp. EMM_F5]
MAEEIDMLFELHRQSGTAIHIDSTSMRLVDGDYAVPQQVAQATPSESSDSEWASNIMRQAFTDPALQSPSLSTETHLHPLGLKDQSFLQGDVFGTGMMM